MPSERTPLVDSTLKRGTFCPAGPSDKRSPCPLVNALANHGYISRDGKNIRASDLSAAVGEVGLASTVGAILSNAIYNEYQDPKTAYLQKRPGILTRLWNFLRNPYIILSFFGVRRPRQVDSAGKKVVDLDQLALPGVIEHDISMTRCDYAQAEGNTVLQQKLVQKMLDSSTDGGKTLTMENLVKFRKSRIQDQFDNNPELRYGSLQHAIACGEVAMILDLFGDGKSVPCAYARAFFEEERLPVKEGWRRRWWWTLGFIELGGTVKKVKSMIGLDV